MQSYSKIWYAIGEYHILLGGEIMQTYETLLKEKILENQQELLDVIRKGIAIPSVKGEGTKDAPYGMPIQEMLTFALNLGEQWGLKTKNVGNKAGWVEVGEGDSMVAILGHLDVVPEGEGWTYPPFGAEIHAGKLYGRGVLDDKGPTLGAMYVLKLIKDLGIPLQKRIRVIFGMDEECGASCMQHYIASGEEMPEAGFTPDAEYPLIFFEKGIIHCKIGKKNPEKGDLFVEKMEAGMAINIVPPKCTLIADKNINIKENEKISVSKQGETIKIEASGRDAHASRPSNGENAILNLVKQIKDIAFGGDFQYLIDFIYDKIDAEGNGKKLDIYVSDEETGETTLNLGMLQYDAEQMTLDLDIRYPKNGNAETIMAKVKQAAETYGMEVLETRQTDMLYVPQDTALVQKLVKVYQDVTGDMQKPLAIGGGTYAKMFPNMVAFGPVFPDMTETIHQPNEHVEVERLITSIIISGLAILSLAEE